MTNIRLPNDTDIILDEYDLMYLNELSQSARKAGVKEKVNPKMVFDFVKSQLTLIEIEKLQQQLPKLIGLFEYSKELNQLALYDNACLQVKQISCEQIAYNSGIEKYVSKSDLTKYIEFVEDKVIKLKQLSEFPRIIPDENKKIIKSFQDKKIFDELWIIYTSYGEDLKSNKEKIREKDPIVFGVFECNPTKYYYITDWIDEYCDITFDELVDKLEELDNGYQVNFIKEISNEKIKEMIKINEDKARRLKQTTRNNFRSLMGKEEKGMRRVISDALQFIKIWKKH